MMDNTPDSFYKYWIGQDINYHEIWQNYISGERGYINKFEMSNTSLIKINFDSPPKGYPLFNHEAIFKTLQGFYHDLKKYTLTDNDYQNAGPLFLYSIERGSAEWSFIIDALQVPMFVMGLYYGYLKIRKLELDIEKTKLEIQRLDNDPEKIKKVEDFIKFLPPGLEFALQNLLKNVKSIIWTEKRHSKSSLGDKTREFVFKIETKDNVQLSTNKKGKLITKRETEDDSQASPQQKNMLKNPPKKPKKNS